jgi:hypothetical protein
MCLRQTFSSILILLLFTVTIPCIAADDSGEGFQFSFDLGLGVESFNEDTDGDGIDDDEVSYQKLLLAPDFGFGKFGIGFEVVFHYQFEDNELTIREADWIPAGDDPEFMDYLELYLAKFRYVRYGKKGEPLFAKFGSINDGTLGNGFIIGNYSNTVFLPDKRIFGLGFDLDGALFDFPLVGMETFIGNVVNWNVIGARLYFRPLVFLDIPIVSAMQLGGSVAMDINPDAYYEDDITDPAEIAHFEDAQAAFYDLDVRVPILNNSLLSLAGFADLGTYKFESLGGMVGCGGKLISLITYGAQARFIGEGFIPNYFSSTYELFKIDYYKNIERIAGDPPPGYVGWLATLGLQLEGLFNFQVTLDGPFGEVEADNEGNPSNYPHLRGAFTLAENLVPGVPGLSADAVYDKILIREFGDLIDPEGAFVQAKINYKMAPAVISLIYQLTYSSATGEWDVTSGLETTITF